MLVFYSAKRFYAEIKAKSAKNVHLLRGHLENDSFGN